MVIRSLIFLCCALAAAPALAQDEHAAHAKHDHAGMSGPRDELGTSAAFGPSGDLWIVSKQGDHVVLRRSADLGATWSHPLPVNGTPEPIGADGDARPKIAFGPEGEVYVTWTRPLAKPYTGLIRFARSLDGGRTFDRPVTVHVDRQEITHRFDALAVTRDGKIFVAWIDKRNAEAQRAKGAAYAGAALYFAVSDDRGGRFRGDFKVADHSCECCRIALLPQANGTVVAFWRHVFAPNLRDHALATLHADGSIDGFRRATFDNWATDACPHHGPSLAEDSAGQLHGVWFDLGPEHAGALYGRLREGGVDAQKRIGGEGAEHPDLAVSGSRIAVAWKEFDGRQSRLRGMLSDDDGKSWREVDLATTSGASDQPRVLVSKGRSYVVWNTRQDAIRVLPLQ
jgi:hypothetical protein